MLDKMNWHHEIEHDHQGWWFWGEDWSFKYGPFFSRQEAERELEKYALVLEAEVRSDDS